jgi:uncharacterized protein YifE (UPF0438 family)
MKKFEPEYRKIIKSQKIQSQKIPLTSRIIRNTSYVPTNPHGEHKKNPPSYKQDKLTNPRKAIFDMHKIYELDRQMKHVLKNCKNSKNPKQTAEYVWAMYKGVIRTVLNRIHELFTSQHSFYTTHENNLKYLLDYPFPTGTAKQKKNGKLLSTSLIIQSSMVLRHI